MEPRPFSRGNPCTPSSTAALPPTFNGAATFQSRKPVRKDGGGLLNKILQWSRDLSVAETGLSRRRSSTGGRLQWSRDLSVAETSRNRRDLRTHNPFNGAATFQSRKPEHTETKTVERKCLQWSRDLSVAETRASRPLPVPVRALQWSRDLSVAETCPNCGRMAPITHKNLQWSRDLSVAETVIDCQEYHVEVF